MSVFIFLNILAGSIDAGKRCSENSYYWLSICRTIQSIKKGSFLVKVEACQDFSNGIFSVMLFRLQCEWLPQVIGWSLKIIFWLVIVSNFDGTKKL